MVEKEMLLKKLKQEIKKIVKNKYKLLMKNDDFEYKLLYKINTKSNQ